MPTSARTETDALGAVTLPAAARCLRGLELDERRCRELVS